MHRHGEAIWGPEMLHLVQNVDRQDIDRKVVALRNVHRKGSEGLVSGWSQPIFSTSRLASGKHATNYGKISIFHGKIHYFYGHFQ
jgi:hypothetical protein